MKRFRVYQVRTGTVVKFVGGWSLEFGVGVGVGVEVAGCRFCNQASKTASTKTTELHVPTV